MCDPMSQILQLCQQILLLLEPVVSGLSESRFTKHKMCQTNNAHRKTLNLCPQQGAWGITVVILTQGRILSVLLIQLGLAGLSQFFIKSIYVSFSDFTTIPKIFHD